MLFLVYIIEKYEYSDATIAKMEGGVYDAGDHNTFTTEKSRTGNIAVNSTRCAKLFYFLYRKEYYTPKPTSKVNRRKVHLGFGV